MDLEAASLVVGGSFERKHVGTRDEYLIGQVRQALSHFETEPFGDLRMNADRAAVIAVAALKSEFKRAPLMNPEQKQALRSIVIFVGIKAALYAGIYFAAKRYRHIISLVEDGDFDAMKTYSDKDVKMTENIHGNLVLDETGKVVGGFYPPVDQ